MPATTVQGGSPVTTIRILDSPGPGGANHRYQIASPEGLEMGYVQFQCGPIKEVSVNGVFDEDLVAILIHRLECFQSNDLRCEQNNHTLKHLRAAARSMRKRQEDRVARGVEGTSEP